MSLVGLSSYEIKGCSFSRENNCSWVFAEVFIEVFAEVFVGVLSELAGD